MFHGGSWEELLGALWRHDCTLRLNARALAKFMYSGYVWGDDTLVEGVYQVPPGSVVTFDEKGCRTRSYYAFERAPERGRDAVEEVRVGLERFFAHYQDQKVLLTLSGGWDSRTLLSLAKRAGLPLETITLGYREGQWDDFGVARQLARQAGAAHHFWRLRPERFTDHAERLIMSSGGTCDAVISYSDGLEGYAEVASDFDVVLRGDECFGWGTTSLSVRHARKQLGLYEAPPEGVEAGALETLFSEELATLDFGRQGKSADDVKNTFYWRHRLPRYIMPVAHWQRLAAPGTRIEHPYLSRRVLEAVPGGGTGGRRARRDRQ